MGQVNHYLLEGSKFFKRERGYYIENATINYYKLFSKHGLPYIVYTGKVKDKVVGEIYELHPALFRVIDNMERACMYHRVEILPEIFAYAKGTECFNSKLEVKGIEVKGGDYNTEYPPILP